MRMIKDRWRDQLGKVKPGLDSLVDMPPTQPSRGRLEPHGSAHVNRRSLKTVRQGYSWVDPISQWIVHFSSVQWGATVTAWARTCNISKGIIRATAVWLGLCQQTTILRFSFSYSSNGADGLWAMRMWPGREVSSDGSGFRKRCTRHLSQHCISSTFWSYSIRTALWNPLASSEHTEYWVC